MFLPSLSSISDKPSGISQEPFPVFPFHAGTAFLPVLPKRAVKCCHRCTESENEGLRSLTSLLYFGFSTCVESVKTSGKHGNQETESEESDVHTDSFCSSGL